MSQEPVRYLTDDRDERKRNELVIMQGGNGDWYVAVVPEGTGTIGRAVRLCTSGGASTHAPGLPSAIADAYRAMQQAGEEAAPTVMPEGWVKSQDGGGNEQWKKEGNQWAVVKEGGKYGRWALTLLGERRAFIQTLHKERFKTPKRAAAFAETVEHVKIRG